MQQVLKKPPSVQEVKTSSVLMFITTVQKYETSQHALMNPSVYMMKEVYLIPITYRPKVKAKMVVL